MFSKFVVRNIAVQQAFSISLHTLGSSVTTPASSALSESFFRSISVMTQEGHVNMYNILVSRVVTRAYAQELAPWALYGLILYLGDQDYLPSEVVQPAGRGIKDESYQPNELVKKVEKGHELREFIVTYLRNVNFNFIFRFLFSKFF